MENIVFSHKNGVCSLMSGQRGNLDMQKRSFFPVLQPVKRLRLLKEVYKT